MNKTYYENKLKQIQQDSKQYEAYLSNKNMVVLAGPGSGKTTVLTLKIMKLLKEIPFPRGLVCVTFSNESAKEFKKRLLDLGLQTRKNVFLGTVHSFCIAEIITKYSHLFPKYKIPRILKFISNNEKRKLFKKVLNELLFDENEVSLEDMDKERRLKIPGVSQIAIPSYDIALKTAVKYEKKLAELGLVDFNSIVQYATLLIHDFRLKKILDNIKLD